MTDYKKNCVSLLRIIAAFQVMWLHLIEHLEAPFPVLKCGISLDDIISWPLYFFNGVPLFFFLSGYLIWISMGKYRNCKDYYFNRFLRIYPELWIGVIVEIVLLVIFVYPVNFRDIVLFAGTQSTVLQFWTPDSLRSFGCGTPNGSLWTICVLIQFYVIVWPIKKFCSNKSAFFWGAMEIVMVAIGAATQLIRDNLPEILFKLYCQTIVQYLWIFLLGIIIAEYRNVLIPVLSKYWFITGICAVLMRFSPFDLRARNFLILYTVFCLLTSIGLAYRFNSITVKPDISYALYIYHMLVVNVIIELGYARNMVAFVVCMIASFVLAYISTITVGKSAQKFKRT